MFVEKNFDKKFMLPSFLCFITSIKLYDSLKSLSIIFYVYVCEQQVLAPSISKNII